MSNFKEKIQRDLERRNMKMEINNINNETIMKIQILKIEESLKQSVLSVKIMKVRMK